MIILPRTYATVPQIQLATIQNGNDKTRLQSAHTRKW